MSCHWPRVHVASPGYSCVTHSFVISSPPLTGIFFRAPRCFLSLRQERRWKDRFGSARRCPEGPWTESQDVRSKEDRDGGGPSWYVMTTRMKIIFLVTCWARCALLAVWRYSSIFAFVIAKPASHHLLRCVHADQEVRKMGSGKDTCVSLAMSMLIRDVLDIFRASLSKCCNFLWTNRVYPHSATPQ